MKELEELAVRGACTAVPTPLWLCGGRKVGGGNATPTPARSSRRPPVHCRHTCCRRTDTHTSVTTGAAVDVRHRSSPPPPHQPAVATVPPDPQSRRRPRYRRNACRLTIAALSEHPRTVGAVADKHRRAEAYLRRRGDLLKPRFQPASDLLTEVAC